MDAQLLINVLYETKYKIHNHAKRVGKKRPFAAIAFHPAEDVNKDSGLQMRLRRFVRSNIYDLTGLNLFQWLSLPPDVFRMLDEEIDSHLKEKTEALRKAKEDMEIKKSPHKT